MVSRSQTVKTAYDQAEEIVTSDPNAHVDIVMIPPIDGNVTEGDSDDDDQAQDINRLRYCNI